MKRLTLVVVLATTLSCDSSDSPIRLLRALTVVGDTLRDCRGLIESYHASGQLDLDSPTTRYLLALEVESRLARPTTVVGERELATPNINDAILRQVELTYRWPARPGTTNCQRNPSTPDVAPDPNKPDCSLPDKEIMSMHFIVEAGAERESNTLVIDGIGPQMMDKLMTRRGGTLGSQLGISTAPLTTLFVEVQIKGELGGGRPFSTNKITWPIGLSNNFEFDPTTCTPPRRVNELRAPCGLPPGQDDYAWDCPRISPDAGS